MSDRDIEDTREENVVMIDPLEWWERVDDSLEEELRDFVHEEIDSLERSKSSLLRDNVAIGQQLKDAKRLIEHVTTFVKSAVDGRLTQREVSELIDFLQAGN